MLVGAAGGYKYEIQALNAIDKAKGGTGLHKYNIDALNSICKAAGGSGVNKYEIAALAFIGSNVNPLPVLLLDVFPNATSAYSLRKLRSDYEGAAIRVRRSGDNAEMDIGFNGINLDVTTLLLFVNGGDGYVTTWYNQGDTAYNIKSDINGNQPIICNAGVLIEDVGKPAVLFNGTSSFMEFEDNAVFRNISATSVFIVAKNNTSIRGNLLDARTFSSTGQSLKNRFLIRSYNSMYQFGGRRLDEDSIRIIGTTVISELQSFISITLNYIGRVVNFKVNNIDAGSIVDFQTSGNTSNTDSYGIIIGKNTNDNEYWDGTMQEMIIYQNDKTLQCEDIYLNQINYYDDPNYYNVSPNWIVL